MSEESYDEENLDEFMLNAAVILSQKSNTEKNTILDSLKQHLSSIYENKDEMDNFFKTLNSVIFSEDLKIKHKQVYILYPIIYSFNPKLLINYFDFFLDSLQICITEENKNEFTFFSEVFSDVIQSFYNEKNKNTVKKNLLDKKSKSFLFKKILNFCEKNIKTNRKLEQSFGCLILTEFIEKCPLVKDEKNLEVIFKKISDYLDDRWFECKLDLLNCTISLIFSAENKFKPYSNTCLFRIMDYLTDPDWMMRKLAINIVYTLVFYCKDEILAVKENIIEFLNALKEDEKDEIKEVCKQILAFIQNDSNNNSKEQSNKSNKDISDINNKKANKNKDTKDPREKIVSPKNELKEKKINDSEDTKKNSIKNSNVNSAINNSKNINDLVELDSKINLILAEINKIKEEQEKFKIQLEYLVQKEENNYNILNEKFKIIEHKNKLKKRNYLLHNNSASKNEARSYNTEYNYSPKEKRVIKQNIFLTKQYEEAKIENLKNNFKNGKYNEALLETKQNDKYLLKILPLIDKDIIPKIEIAILEDTICRLNKRIFILCMEEGWETISDILMFYKQLLISKIKLKNIIKMSIKDAMNFLKSRGNNYLEENDKNIIDKIITIVKL